MERNWIKITEYKGLGILYSIFWKRNVNFYVNKCGFHIAEHKDSHSQDQNSDDHHPDFDYFRFEKVMK